MLSINKELLIRQLFRTSQAQPVPLSMLFMCLFGLHSKILVVGGYRGGFDEKLPEASPISYRANASWL